MAYSVINKTGCCERKGNLQIRLDFFLEEDDSRYQDSLVSTQDDRGVSYIQYVPFHSHFAYFDPNVTDEEIKAEMDYHLHNFYKAYQDGQDKIDGGMRHGFAVEKRLGCLDYSQLDSKEDFELRQSQVNEKLLSLSDINSKPISINDGKYYPATTIDVGIAANDRASQLIGGYTYIGVDNPANDTGILDTIEIWAYSNMSGCKAGTFSGSSTSYDDRDYETIGSVTAGSRQTFTGLAIDVTSGDFLGFYCSSGYIEASTSGGSGVYDKSGDQFGSGVQTYALINGYGISLYGTGETLEATRLLSLLGVGK